jgi:hypothetical protein
MTRIDGVVGLGGGAGGVIGGVGVGGFGEEVVIR